MDKRFVVFIPVRGGSKSIPLKNIKPFLGKPLVYWTVKAACDCSFIDKVYVSTDSDEIIKTVNGFGFKKTEIVKRSADTATDSASTESAMIEFAKNNSFDSIVLVQATSPLLEASDLTAAINQYIEKSADSLLSVVRQRRFCWGYKGDFAIPINYEPLRRPRRQDWDGFLVENGAFYITSRQRLIDTQCRISGNIDLFEMKEDTYFEIDEKADWVIAEMLKRKRLDEIKHKSPGFNNINLLISDVDGVLTDAGMYYSVDGDVLKKFNTKDGKGIELLRTAGIRFMILTSEDTRIVEKRGLKLKADFVFTNVKDKKSFLYDFFQKNEEFSFQTTAYIGDDINDMESMAQSCFSATPADGIQSLKSFADYICVNKGGCGCVRELCDLILSRRTNG
jgi:YrbI family 3-deoxy-D-manno-octulosonate 8-phosphate phosphatase